MDNRYEEVGSETWPMSPWWKWPVHRIWLPKGKKTGKHNVQKGRAKSMCDPGNSERTDGWKWCEGFEDQCSGMSSLRKSAPWCQEFSCHDGAEQTFISGSLFREKLNLWKPVIYSWLQDLRSQCAVFQSVISEPHSSEWPERSFNVQIPGPTLKLVESEVFGGWPLWFWTFHKLSRRLLNYSTDLRYN